MPVVNSALDALGASVSLPDFQRKYPAASAAIHTSGIPVVSHRIAQLYRRWCHVLRETGIIEQPGHSVTQYQQHTFEDVRCINRLQFPNIDSMRAMKASTIRATAESALSLSNWLGFSSICAVPYFIRSSMPCRQRAAKLAYDAHRRRLQDADRCRGRH